MICVGIERPAPAQPGRKSVRWTLLQAVGDSPDSRTHPPRDVDGSQLVHHRCAEFERPPRHSRGEKVSGGHFFRPWEIPLASGRIPEGCGRKSAYCKLCKNRKTAPAQQHPVGDGALDVPFENVSNSPKAEYSRKVLPLGRRRRRPLQCIQEQKMSRSPFLCLTFPFFLL